MAKNIKEILNISMTKLDYFVILTLLCVSGNPFFTDSTRKEIIIIVVAIFFALLLLRSKKWIVTPKQSLIIFIFILLLLIQSVYFQYLNIITIFGFIVRLFVGCVAIRLIYEFPLKYSIAMVYIGLVSLSFWLINVVASFVGVQFSSLFNFMKSFTSNDSLSILVYTFLPGDDALRNSAFFWEPGAFAGYILLALLFLSGYKNKIDKKTYFKSVGILSISLLTTFSTTGYIIYPIVMTLHYNLFGNDTFESSLRKKLYLLLGCVIFAAYCYSIMNLDFMADKIEYQYNKSLNSIPGETNTRFGSFLFDLDYIKSSPIIGNGLHEITRYRFDMNERLDGHGNGLSDFIAKFGAIGFITYVTMLFNGLFPIMGKSRHRVIIALVIILLTLNGETYLNYPLFLGLMLL